MPQDRLPGLAPVEGEVLDRLVAAAVAGAAADEVTPPVTPGGAWTPERVAWLRSFHEDRRAGLEGEAREATWAVVVQERVVGGVRLARTAQDGVLEAGLWLTRDARGSGTGRRTLAALLHEAAAHGCSAVRADTRADNEAALGVLEALGFRCSTSAGGAVRAEVALEHVSPRARLDRASRVRPGQGP